VPPSRMRAVARAMIFGSMADHPPSPQWNICTA
jgi:hypothetical protein